MTDTATLETTERAAPPTPEGATFVVFSNDMDKALAAFTMATAAAATGMPVTLFFTFWGLAVLRKPERRPRPGFVDRMMSAMVPRGPGKLRMSQLNMLGLGPRMLRWRMKRQAQPALDDLIEQAQALGVRFVACEASAGFLGLDMDDLRDGVEIAGAMTCVRDAARSEFSMFI